MLGVDGVPDADLAGLVGRGDVEAGRGVAGAQNLAGVLGCKAIEEVVFRNNFRDNLSARELQIDPSR